MPQERESAGAASQPEALDPLFEEYLAPTMFGEAEIFTLENDKGVAVRVLYVAGGFQSASYLGERRFEPVFAYYRAIDRVFEARQGASRVLMIGGGAFSYPKHLLTSEDERLAKLRIDVVEIDPAIVDIARAHFFLDEVEGVHGPAGTGRLGIIVADGVDYLLQVDSGAYDVVVNDSFSGTDLTDGLLSPELLQAAKRAMTPGGLYVVNAVVDEPEEAKAFADVLRAAFENVYLLPCPDEDFDGSSNNLLLASDEPAELADLVEL